MDYYQLKHFQIVHTKEWNIKFHLNEFCFVFQCFRYSMLFETEIDNSLSHHLIKYVFIMFLIYFQESNDQIRLSFIFLFIFSIINLYNLFWQDLLLKNLIFQILIFNQQNKDKAIDLKNFLNGFY